MTHDAGWISRERRRVGGLLLLGAAAALLCAPGCRRSDPNLIPASGQIEATELRISSKIAGTLTAFALSEGDRVVPSQEMARLDTTDIALALNAARADRDQAAAELKLRLAGSRDEDVREAEALLARAQSELDGAERDLTRMQALLDSGSGTAKGRDDARTRRDLADAARDAAREQLRRRKNGSRPEEIEAARARLAGAEARAAQFEQQARDAVIRSPLAAVLTEKLAEPGELVGAGSVLCVLTDLDHPWLSVYVGEPDLERIRLGDEAEVITDGGRRKTGRITMIADRAEFTPKNAQTRQERVTLVYKVKIALNNADGLFKPGMPAEARLHGGHDREHR